MQQPLPYPRFLPVGDAAITVEFGNKVDPGLNDKVIALDIALAAAELDGIRETVPSYRSLLVCYDPLEISFHSLVAELHGLVSRLPRMPANRSTLWTVPVIYDQPYAEDIPEVARRVGLSEEQVAAVHSAAEYHVYSIGYAPGMPYLGGVPPALHISRRELPRPQVKPGAVMIGGVQAAIVPTEVPSAWYILGQTPLRPFDLRRQDPFLFRPGDRVRFRRVDKPEFNRLSGLQQDAFLSLISGAA